MSSGCNPPSLVCLLFFKQEMLVIRLLYMVKLKMSSWLIIGVKIWLDTTGCRPPCTRDFLCIPSCMENVIIIQDRCSKVLQGRKRECLWWQVNNFYELIKRAIVILDGQILHVQGPTLLVKALALFDSQPRRRSKFMQKTLLEMMDLVFGFLMSCFLRWWEELAYIPHSKRTNNFFVVEKSLSFSKHTHSSSLKMNAWIIEILESYFRVLFHCAYNWFLLGLQE